MLRSTNSLTQFVWFTKGTAPLQYKNLCPSSINDEQLLFTVQGRLWNVSLLYSRIPCIGHKTILHESKILSSKCSMVGQSNQQAYCHTNRLYGDWMPCPLALFAVDVSAQLVVASLRPVSAQRLGAALQQETDEKRFHFTWFTYPLKTWKLRTG